MRTGIGIVTEIIQKVDIRSGDDGVCLDIALKQGNDMISIELSRVDYLEELLILLGKKSFLEVTDVPVRMLVVEQIGDDDSVSDEMEVVAIGDLLEDSWLLLSDEDEVDRVCFDTLIEAWEQQGVEFVVFY